MPGAMIGFDMTAVLAMAGASGIPGALVHEFMPALETALATAHNREAEGDGGKTGISPAEG